MKFILPFPSSVNSYWRSLNKGTTKGELLANEAGCNSRHVVRAAIIEQLKAVPKLSVSPAGVVITLHPLDYRRRDLDNYNKAFSDILTYAGIWEDDNQVKRMTIEWGESAKGGRVETTITAFNKVLDVCSVVG